MSFSFRFLIPSKCRTESFVIVGIQESLAKIIRKLATRKRIWKFPVPISSALLTIFGALPGFCLNKTATKKVRIA